MVVVMDDVTSRVRLRVTVVFSVTDFVFVSSKVEDGAGVCVGVLSGTIVLVCFVVPVRVRSAV